MTQTVASTCVLGPGQTGLAIGLRVLNLDGTTYSAFSTTGVTETSVLGTYRKANGTVVPDTGGYIVWGTAATDKAEATVDSLPAAAPSASTVASTILSSDTTGYVSGTVGAALESTGALGDPWAAPVRTLTQSAAAVAASMTGTTLAITNSTGFAATIIGLTIPATWTAIDFTIKSDSADADARSIVQIRVSNPAAALTDGLQYLNQAVAATKAAGTLTVNQAGGTVAIALKAVATVQLGIAVGLAYDLTLFRSDGEPSILTASTASVGLTPTKAIT